MLLPLEFLFSSQFCLVATTVVIAAEGISATAVVVIATTTIADENENQDNPKA